MHTAAWLGPTDLLKAGGVTALYLSTGRVTQICVETAGSFFLQLYLLFVGNPLYFFSFMM